MSSPYSSQSEESEVTALAQDFRATNINATRRRSSTTQGPTLNQSGQPDADENPSVELDEENANAPTTRQLRRRKNQNPINRLRNFEKMMVKLQMSPHFMIPRAPFGRVVHEILLQRISPAEISNFRITAGALEALQTATEMYVTQRFQDAYLLTMHRGRVTLEVRDMTLMAFICQHFGHL